MTTIRIIYLGRSSNYLIICLGNKQTNKIKFNGIATQSFSDVLLFIIE